MRLNRGGGYLNEFKQLFYVVVGVKLLGYDTIFSFLIGISIVLFSWFLGWLDEKKLKIWQMENELHLKRYNPYMDKQLKRR